MKFSIIVPIFNTVKHVNRCVDSVLAQTFSDFELILVDDGSQDDCPRICDEYAGKDSRILVIHKENGGVSTARNAGINISKGEYIIFVDSDDMVMPQLLETVCEHNGDNNADIVSFGIENVTSDNKQLNVSRLPSFFAESKEAFSQYFDDYFKTLFGSACIKCYKANIIKENNILFKTGIHIFEDWFFDADATQCSNSFLNIDFIGYRYFKYENSCSHKGRNDIVDVAILKAERYILFLQAMKYDTLPQIEKENVICSAVVAQYMQAATSSTQFDFDERIQILKKLYSNKEYKVYISQSLAKLPLFLQRTLGKISLALNLPSIVAAPVYLKNKMNRKK